MSTHEYTDDEFSESDDDDDNDDDDVDAVPLWCPLAEREELHLPEQIIDNPSFFAVNVTSDVSNQTKTYYFRLHQSYWYIFEVSWYRIIDNILYQSN